MATDVRALYHRAMDAFGDYVHAVRDDQWGAPTPCPDWDARALVNHVVGENRWAVPLFAGGTIADVGDRFDGDLLSSDPVAAWDDSAAGAIAAVDDPGAMERTVHLSFGDFPGREYAMQLLADLVVHGWDLARATGQDETIDPEEIEPLQAMVDSMGPMMLENGVIKRQLEPAPDASPQERLLAGLGRQA